MKKLWRVFILHFQDALESRSRSFVWFLLALINPLISMIFLQGAIKTGLVNLDSWNHTSIALYYLLLVVSNALLVVHIEEKIAEYDIHQGRLSTFLLKPYSYLWFNLLTELPYRMIQSTFGLLIFAGVVLLYRNMFSISHSFISLLLALIITVLAFVVSFLFKMVVGISAFWFTDYRGFQQVVEVSMIVFAGIVMPIGLYPEFLIKICKLLPFVYIIYYPIIAWMGQLGLISAVKIVGCQLLWIGILYLIYKSLWFKGKKIFSGVGM